MTMQKLTLNFVDNKINEQDFKVLIDYIKTAEEKVFLNKRYQFQSEKDFFVNSELDAKQGVDIHMISTRQTLEGYVPDEEIRFVIHAYKNKVTSLVLSFITRRHDHCILEKTRAEFPLWSHIQLFFSEEGSIKSISTEFQTVFREKWNAHVIISHITEEDKSRIKLTCKTFPIAMEKHTWSLEYISDDMFDHFLLIMKALQIVRRAPPEQVEIFTKKEVSHSQIKPFIIEMLNTPLSELINKIELIAMLKI